MFVLLGIPVVQKEIIHKCVYFFQTGWLDTFLTALILIILTLLGISGHLPYILDGML